MVSQSVIESVKKYTEIVRSRFPIKRAILFGSFARGTQHPDSDIDVAFVLDKQPADVLSTETELFKLRRNIDLRIEPVIVEEEPDLSGFYEDISTYGTIIYSST